jgi:hypothetical protein
MSLYMSTGKYLAESLSESDSDSIYDRSGLECDNRNGRFFDLIERVKLFERLSCYRGGIFELVRNIIC